MNPRARRLTRAITIAGILSALTGEPMKAQPQAPPQLPPPIVPAPLIPDVRPVRTCESLGFLVLPDTTIESAVIDQGNGTIPASCRVTAIATHPPAGDRITIWIALPVAGWNGRFQGVGGGGFSRPAAACRLRRRFDRHRSCRRRRQLRARRQRPSELAADS